MAPAELDLLSTTQLHKLAPRHDHHTVESDADADGDDSWEVKAFMKDRMGAATWPPRSYTCTFCRREFRSAQALGGHMNVHRRDRARLRQQCDVVNPPLLPPQLPGSAASAGRLCYANPNNELAGGGNKNGEVLEGERDGVKVEEIDLELRLGWS